MKHNQKREIDQQMKNTENYPKVRLLEGVFELNKTCWLIEERADSGNVGTATIRKMSDKNLTRETQPEKWIHHKEGKWCDNQDAEESKTGHST